MLVMERKSVRFFEGQKSGRKHFKGFRHMYILFVRDLMAPKLTLRAKREPFWPAASVNPRTDLPHLQG